MKKVSAADLDKFLDERHAAPVRAELVEETNPLEAMNSALGKGSNTLGQINELLSNANRLIENFQGIVMKGVERKEAQRMGNQPDYEAIARKAQEAQAGAANKAAESGGYGKNTVEENAQPQRTEQPAQPTPPGAVPPPPPEVPRDERAKRIYAWFGLILDQLIQTRPELTAKELRDDWAAGAEELTKHIEAFLR